VLINTEARGKGMADALRDATIVVLRQHGTVTVGISAEESMVRMVAADDNARAQYEALQIGAPLFFHGEELKQLKGEHSGPHGVLKQWHYYEETAALKGALEGL
jgi:L-fuculose-phosphate aldolase